MAMERRQQKRYTLEDAEQVLVQQARALIRRVYPHGQSTYELRLSIDENLKPKLMVRPGWQHVDG